MFAVLEFWDFFLIWVMLGLVVAQIATTMGRVEAKVDQVMRHLGVVYVTPPEEVLTPAGKRGIIVGIAAVVVLLAFILFRWL